MTYIREKVSEQAELQAFAIGGDDYVSLEVEFAFESWRSDIDNPLKRLLDSLSEALGFNDNRVVEVLLRKQIVGSGNQYVWFKVSTVPEADVPSPIGQKKPSDRPIWVS